MNHPSIPFGFQFVHDGSSNSVTVNMTTGPIYYNLPQTMNALNGAFNATVTGVTGLGNDSGLTIASVAVLLGVLTVTFSGTLPAAGTVIAVNGTATF